MKDNLIKAINAVDSYMESRGEIISAHVTIFSPTKWVIVKATESMGFRYFWVDFTNNALGFVVEAIPRVEHGIDQTDDVDLINAALSDTRMRYQISDT